MLMFMGIVSLVVGCQQKFDFSPWLHWLLWERSWVRTYESVSRRAVDCAGSPSSRGRWICSNLLTTVQNIAICGPCKIRIVLDYTQTEHEKCARVGQVFPCMVYIDSNRRNSRI
jgi:hypothetical protein